MTPSAAKADRSSRARDVLGEHYRDLVTLVTAVLMAICFYLLVTVMNRQAAIAERQVAIQERQAAMQAEYTGYVGTLARWQGPTSLSTETTIDGRATRLAVQEERGPCEIENALERTRDGLKRLVAHKE